jgi:hypothetical protein
VQGPLLAAPAALLLQPPAQQVLVQGHVLPRSLPLPLQQLLPGCHLLEQPLLSLRVARGVLLGQQQAGLQRAQLRGQAAQQRRQQEWNSTNTRQPG